MLFKETKIFDERADILEFPEPKTLDPLVHTHVATPEFPATPLGASKECVDVYKYVHLLGGEALVDENEPNLIRYSISVEDNRSISVTSLDYRFASEQADIETSAWKSLPAQYSDASQLRLEAKITFLEQDFELDQPELSYALEVRATDSDQNMSISQSCFRLHLLPVPLRFHSVEKGTLERMSLESDSNISSILNGNGSASITTLEIENLTRMPAWVQLQGTLADTDCVKSYRKSSYADSVDSTIDYVCSDVMVEFNSACVLEDPRPSVDSRNVECTTGQETEMFVTRIASHEYNVITAIPMSSQPARAQNNPQVQSRRG